jgi:hypothetical protein
MTVLLESCKWTSSNQRFFCRPAEFNILIWILIRELIDGIGCGFDRRHHFFYSGLDISDLRMHFPDEVMLSSREILDSLALFAKFSHKSILLCRYLMHPKKACTPAEYPDYGHPERKIVSVHPRHSTRLHMKKPTEGGLWRITLGLWLLALLDYIGPVNSGRARPSMRVPVRSVVD